MVGIRSVDLSWPSEIKIPLKPTLTPPEIARLVEFTEAEAYVDLFRSAPAHMGFQAYSIQASTMLLAPDFDIPLFTRVLGSGLLEPVALQSIDWITGQFQQHGVRNYALQICPHARPRALVTWLESRQLIPRDNWAKVFRPSHPTVSIPSSLRFDQLC